MANSRPVVVIPATSGRFSSAPIAPKIKKVAAYARVSTEAFVSADT